ncbi:LiaI-LiaF-like domain-containing protein [Roseateles cellulosilyticus]|uniref:Cell wall-active antibiotics response protein n=1 Tax=Pelomonas cellulosilytica TaxID=2906762 RepID=A0ABS8XTM1_9BURK|nr:DUF5668 domain-containing protein [Pelomonas sp. P8]MCE4554553.1 cell wall-active antibiotics response protein [Pelomonas sp. P8]
MSRYRHRHRGHPGHRILFGLAVIGIGTLALLDNLRLFDAALLHTYWPLALVVWGLGRLVWPPHPGGSLFGLLLIIGGLALTANHVGVLNVHPRDWWPVLVIVVGLSIVSRSFWPRRCRGLPSGFDSVAAEHGELLDIDANFSAIKQRNDSASFKGGRISSTFGGIDIDLTHATLAGGEARLQVDARFSGIVLHVPRDWLVVAEIDPVFGGIENKTVPPLAPMQRLLLRGRVVFGGVEIKN